MRLRKPTFVRFVLLYGGAITCIALCVLIFDAFFLNPQSKLAMTYREVDISSGRMRDVDYDLWIRRERAPEETWVSEAIRLGKYTVDEPKWRTTGSQGRHPSTTKIYVSYRWGGIPTQVRSMDTAFQLYPPTADAKSEIARELVASWRAFDANRKAPHDYADALGIWLSDKPVDTQVTAEQVREFNKQYHKRNLNPPNESPLR